VLIEQETIEKGYLSQKIFKNDLIVSAASGVQLSWYTLIVTVKPVVETPKRIIGENICKTKH